MANPTERPIFITVEGVIESWLKDLGSLGSLALLIYVNHVYGAGNWFVDSTGVVLLWAYMFSGKREGVYRFTVTELRKWAIDQQSDWPPRSDSKPATFI